MGLFGKRLKEPIRGTAQVVSATGARSNAAYTPIEMTLVVQGPGVPATSVQFRQRAARTTKFPFPGQVIPVEIDQTDPTNVKVLWDELPTRKEHLAAQGDALAAGMRGTPPGQRPTTFTPASTTGTPDITGQVSDVLDQLRQAFPTADITVSQGETTDAASPRAAVNNADDRVAKLERLVSLRDAGALSADEFEAEKARVLRED